jgi:hypothetical protein
MYFRAEKNPVVEPRAAYVVVVVCGRLCSFQDVIRANESLRFGREPSFFLRLVNTLQ